VAFNLASQNARKVSNLVIPLFAAGVTSMQQIYSLKGGRIGHAVDAYQALVNGKKLTPEQKKLAAKMMIAGTGFLVMGLLYQAAADMWWPDEEEAEDPGNTYLNIRDPDSKRILFRMVKPRSGMLFINLGQSLYDMAKGRPDRAARRMADAMRQEVPGATASTPWALPLADIADKGINPLDPFTFNKEIEGKYQQDNYFPAQRVKYNTTPISRWLGQITGPTIGMSPIVLDHYLNGLTASRYADVQAAGTMTYNSAANLAQGKSPIGNGGWEPSRTFMGVVVPEKDYFESKRLLRDEYMPNVTRSINHYAAKGEDVTTWKQKDIRAKLADDIIKELDKASNVEMDNDTREIYKRAIAGAAQWGMGQNDGMPNPLLTGDEWPEALALLVDDKLKNFVYNATEATSTESKEGKSDRYDEDTLNRREVLKQLLGEDKIKFYLQHELSDKRKGRMFNYGTYRTRISRLGIDP
jgi:hypothetical protein